MKISLFSPFNGLDVGLAKVNIGSHSDALDVRDTNNTVFYLDEEDG